MFPLSQFTAFEHWLTKGWGGQGGGEGLYIFNSVPNDVRINSGIFTLLVDALGLTLGFYVAATQQSLLRHKAILKMTLCESAAHRLAPSSTNCSWERNLYVQWCIFFSFCVMFRAYTSIRHLRKVGPGFTGPINLMVLDWWNLLNGNEGTRALWLFWKYDQFCPFET